MTQSQRLRHAILGALATSQAFTPLLVGCGSRTGIDLGGAGGVAGDTGTGGSAGGSGGTSSGGSGGTGGSVGGSGGTGGKPVVNCSFGSKVESCMSPDEAWYIADHPPQGGDMVGNCPPADMVQNSCCNTAQAMWEQAGQCCYVFCEGACCGRPFTLDGELVLAELVERSDFSTELGVAATPSACIADAWLRDAKMEHASVASFARTVLELLSFGAPPELLRDAEAAIGDEIEHTRLCFGLAERFGADKLGPGPFPLQGLVLERSLEAFAVATFREGAVAETIAALAAREALGGARDAEVHAALRTIADDEERHATFAFRCLAFALAQGHESVRTALERELAELELPPLDEPARALDVSAEAFRAAGRLLPEELVAVAERARHEVIEPCMRALLASVRRHGSLETHASS
ncbi:MAG: ferritin-like domain-containing protein [Polyangiaceae bacterium]